MTDPCTMIATLIDQLIQKSCTKEAVQALYEKRSTSVEPRCTDLDKLWALFQQLVRDCSETIYILIDALDESTGDSRQELLKLIETGQWSELGIRLAITTRVENDIRKTAEKVGSQIGLETSAIHEDIALFVREKLLEKDYEGLKPFREQILNVLPGKAQGMFRYAALTLYELQKNGNPSLSVEEVLASIPLGLHGIYKWILERLGSETINPRKRILLWVALAERPISVREAGLACALRDGDTTFDPSKYNLLTDDRIIEICGPLIEINAEGNLQFTHFSVKEFLLSGEQPLIQPSSALVTQCMIEDLGVGHLAMATTCSKI